MITCLHLRGVDDPGGGGGADHHQPAQQVGGVVLGGVAGELSLREY